MITKELVDRINALWHKQNSVGLTEEEKEEQKKVRRQYIEGIKSQIRYSLEGIKMAEESTDHHSSAGENCSCKKCTH